MKTKKNITTLDELLDEIWPEAKKCPEWKIKGN
jgi:hypothetical protein